MTPEQQKELEAEVRLQAIETVLTAFIAGYHHASGMTIERVRQSHQRLLEKLRLEPWPSKDAALSDHASAEYEAAVSALLQRVENEMMARSQ